jgi:3-methyladenine DNA glycosylase/8-oxoguanine DNA glycosylase
MATELFLNRPGLQACQVSGEFRLMQRRESSYVSAYDIATIHLALGETDAACRWLDEAYAEHASFLIHIHWDPRFDNIRDDPRFDALIRRIRLPSASRPFRSVEEALSVSSSL